MAAPIVDYPLPWLDTVNTSRDVALQFKLLALQNRLVVLSLQNGLKYRSRNGESLWTLSMECLEDTPDYIRQRIHVSSIIPSGRADQSVSHREELHQSTTPREALVPLVLILGSDHLILALHSNIVHFVPLSHERLRCGEVIRSPSQEGGVHPAHVEQLYIDLGCGTLRLHFALTAASNNKESILVTESGPHILEPLSAILSAPPTERCPLVRQILKGNIHGTGAEWPNEATSVSPQHRHVSHSIDATLAQQEIGPGAKGEVADSCSSSSIVLSSPLLSPMVSRNPRPSSQMNRLHDRDPIDAAALLTCFRPHPAAYSTVPLQTPEDFAKFQTLMVTEQAARRLIVGQESIVATEGALFQMSTYLRFYAKFVENVFRTMHELFQREYAEPVNQLYTCFSNEKQRLLRVEAAERTRQQFAFEMRLSCVTSDSDVSVIVHTERAERANIIAHQLEVRFLSLVPQLQQLHRIVHYWHEEFTHRANLSAVEKIERAGLYFECALTAPLAMTTTTHMIRTTSPAAERDEPKEPATARTLPRGATDNAAMKQTQQRVYHHGAHLRGEGIRRHIRQLQLDAAGELNTHILRYTTHRRSTTRSISPPVGSAIIVKPLRLASRSKSPTGQHRGAPSCSQNEERPLVDNDQIDELLIREWSKLHEDEYPPIPPPLSARRTAVGVGENLRPSAVSSRPSTRVATPRLHKGGREPSL